MAFLFIFNKSKNKQTKIPKYSHEILSYKLDSTVLPGVQGMPVAELKSKAAFCFVCFWGQSLPSCFVRQISYGGQMIEQKIERDSF